MKNDVKSRSSLRLRPTRKVQTCKMQAQSVKQMPISRGSPWSMMRHCRTRCGLSTALRRPDTVRKLRKMAMDPRPRKPKARRRRDDDPKPEGTFQNKTIVWGRGETEKTSLSSARISPTAGKVDTRTCSSRLPATTMFGIGMSCLAQTRD